VPIYDYSVTKSGIHEISWKYIFFIFPQIFIPATNTLPCAIHVGTLKFTICKKTTLQPIKKKTILQTICRHKTLLQSYYPTLRSGSTRA
jgi:hypothetical protein